MMGGNIMLKNISGSNVACASKIVIIILVYIIFVNSHLCN